MEYVDSGSRDAGQALGAWLERVLLDNPGAIAAVRWQSGFFTRDALGYFAEAFKRLRRKNGAVRLLIGSNQGSTTRVDLEALLQLVGEPRENLNVGVVSNQEAFFHPKTVHVARADGSEAAYVGSANLTGSGVASLHVEAGVILDTRSGDDPSILRDIAAGVDAWFVEGRDGLHVIRRRHDLEDLERLGIIGQRTPARPPSRRRGVSDRTGSEPQLRPLVRLPPLPGLDTAGPDRQRPAGDGGGRVTRRSRAVSPPRKSWMSGART